MYRTLAILAAAALVVSPLTAADAATYKVSAGVSVKLTDVSSSSASARRTTIQGKVTGGSTSGRSVKFYATNSDSLYKVKRYIGSDKLSGGRFSKSYSPTDGGRMTIEVVLRTNDGSRVLATGTTYVDAFRWTSLTEFYHDGKDNTVSGQGSVVERADGENSGSGRQRWTPSYAITGGATAGFDTNSYRCKKINFKVAASQQTNETGYYRVFQNSKTIISGSEAKGSTAFDAYTRKDVRDKMNPKGKVFVKISPSKSGDEADVRIIFGLPKVFCTFPSASTPRV